MPRLLFAHDPYFTLIREPELETELLTVTEVEFEEALNDTIAENDGFVAPNYDYLTTLAPMKTVEDIDGDNFKRNPGLTIPSNPMTLSLFSRVAR